MRDEGYIKYTSITTEGPAPDAALIAGINEARTELFDLGLIGIYPDGVGFGNLSIRTEGTNFVITGSATGEDRILSPAQYAQVQKFDIEKNCVESIGQINASSESMTHGAIYQSAPSCNCVIHVHSPALFAYMLEHDYQATAKDIAYGTPQMALAIQELVLSTDEDVAIFVTAGHDEGVIAYGPTISSVKNILLKTYEKVTKNG